MLFYVVWTFCESADKKFSTSLVGHGAFLWLKENEGMVTIFLLTASKSVLLRTAIITFQVSSWECEQIECLWCLNHSMPSYLPCCQWQLHDSFLIFPFYKKLGKFTFFFWLILIQWEGCLNGTSWQTHGQSITKQWKLNTVLKSYLVKCSQYSYTK